MVDKPPDRGGTNRYDPFHQKDWPYLDPDLSG